jgi:hypothetical protein
MEATVITAIVTAVTDAIVKRLNESALAELPNVIKQIEAAIKAIESCGK